MPRYSREFKERAVELLKSSGRSRNSVSKELGVSYKALSQWVRELEADGVASSANPQEELKQARRRIRQLEMEREILKKAVAFFAKENE